MLCYDYCEPIFEKGKWPNKINKQSILYGHILKTSFLKSDLRQITERLLHGEFENDTLISM